MVYLYIWMIVAAHGNGHQSSHTVSATQPYYGWVNSGEYRSEAACKNAAELLGVASSSRCVPKGNGR